MLKLVFMRWPLHLSAATSYASALDRELVQLKREEEKLVKEIKAAAARRLPHRWRSSCAVEVSSRAHWSLPFAKNNAAYFCQGDAGLMA